ncbi:MAG: pseudouridylate synthase [Saprospiraceae bacterium]|nr:pseudouridylate synthase [Saprospiraceae bacterium]
MLQILFENEELVAINKPNGLLTHRTKISEDKIFALQLVRDQIGQRVYPVHRLDRATSGVLLFAKNSEMASTLGKLIQEQKVDKTYLAIIRGFVEETGVMDLPLFSEKKNKMQPAETRWRRLAQVEMPWEISRYPTSRYSLVEVTPVTGRHQQIRKHFAQIRHPIIGDRRHGDVKHNNYWRDHFNLNHLWLHALKMKFDFSERSIELYSPLPKSWDDYLEKFWGWILS